MRRPVSLLFAVLTPLLMGLSLSACGGPAGQLSFSLATSGDTDSTALKAGQPANFVATIVNNGPGSATGVTVHVTLPAGLRYKSTAEINATTSVRTQPVDAEQNSNAPVWGVWSLPAPVKNADGTEKKSSVAITFQVGVAGDPGNYQLTGEAVGNSKEGHTAAKPLDVTVVPAPILSLSVDVSPTDVHPGDTVTYKATVSNSGSGAANGVGVFLTLPAVFQFSKTLNIGGNAVQSNLIQPLPNTVEVFYSGFEIPPGAGSSPGQLVIEFSATCVKGTITGSFAVSGQLTDDAGDLVKVDQVAPVTVSS